MNKKQIAIEFLKMASSGKVKEAFENKKKEFDALPQEK